MPTHVQFLVVLKSQKERKNPLQNGYKKPMQNAAKVGSRNSQKHFWIGRRISGELSAARSRFFLAFLIMSLTLLWWFVRFLGKAGSSRPCPCHRTAGGVRCGFSLSFLQSGGERSARPRFITIIQFSAGASSKAFYGNPVVSGSS